MSLHRPALWFSEARQNLRGYPILHGSLMVLGLLLGAGIVLGGASEVAVIAAAHRSEQARGSEVLSIRTPAPLDAARCEGLRAVEGIADAGASLERFDASVGALPGAALAVARVTAGYARILWDAPEFNDSIGVGSAAATALGLRPGSEVTLLRPGADALSVRVRQVLPPTQRLPGANQELVIVDLARGPITECLVLPEPGAAAATETLLRSLSEEAIIEPLLKRDRVQERPAERLAARVTRWLPFLAAGTTVLLLAIITFTRRADWALARLLGAGIRDILAIATLETLVLVWLPFAVGTTLGLFTVGLTGNIDPLIVEALADDLARAALLLTWAPLVATGLILARRPVDHLGG